MKKIFILLLILFSAKAHAFGMNDCDPTIGKYLGFTNASGFACGTIPATWNVQSSSHSLTTGTGATGFQVSSTKNSSVHYSVKISVTATIGTQSEGYIALESAPTNSATPSDWIECGRFSNGQNITLAVILQSVQPIGIELSCDVPLGYYTKLRQVTVSGSPAFSYVSGYEVLK